MEGGHVTGVPGEGPGPLPGEEIIRGTTINQ